MPHSFPTRRSSDLAEAAPALFLRERVSPKCNQLIDSRQPRGRSGPAQKQIETANLFEPGQTLIPRFHQRMLEKRQQSRSEEHTSELQSLMRISYAVFCLKKKKTTRTTYTQHASINHKKPNKYHNEHM